MQYSYSLVHSDKASRLIQDALMILGGSILIGLFAHISIPLPFTPVPISTQPHVILLLSLLLGSKRAFLAVLAFLFQGALGLPVFALGKVGMAVLIGPTGGYLLGYAVAAYLTGWMMEKAKKQTFGRTFTALAVGNLAIYFFGFLQLSAFIGIKAALLLGIAPFLVTDFLKLLIVFKFFSKRAS